MSESSATTLLDRIRDAEALESRRAWHAREVATAERRVSDTTTQIATLQARLAQEEAAVVALRLDLDALELPEDTTPLRAALADTERNNAEARRYQQRMRDFEAQKKLRAEYLDLTHAIDAIEQRKAEAIAAAAMPVDGLSFDDDALLWHGHPFRQASSAEQIRVSMAMAMALNPELRVVLIRDGSLLDDDAMAEVARLAEETDTQVWIERVGDESETAVVIEDGTVRR